MNQLTKIFEGQELRIIEKDNEPWFVAKDVCEILDLSNPTKVVSRLDEDERSNFKLGRQGSVNVVNEFGLYNLVLGSRKPEAKNFKRWITHDVIPAIRKTGSYNQPQSQLEILQQSVNQMVEQEKRLTAVEEKQDNINELLSLHPNEWRKKVNKIINQIAQERGGFGAYKDVRKESYEILEERGKCQLSIRLTNRKRKMAFEGASKSKIDKTTKMDVIADDARLTEIYLSVVKEMAIKNNVDMAV
ncbi:BRO-N domain-containing protein [Alkalibacillus almallahensis]|uniref:BRO-N domain-containing protein n=1 Tax=Alkalibacillus almallahensis TaxID=1379154 RepID=UPI00141DCEF2|nr:BRO family protein [Alkalibacillus almallahensis]NIK10882.1 prophage antirepressor-like protein [Alkalibacillus almallahensis]